jgi:hypothetical protein
MALRISALLVSLALTLGQARAENAQTKATDKVPPFTLAYFVGEWAFDWTVPETALGPAGDLVGKETFELFRPGAGSQPRTGYSALPTGLLSDMGTLTETAESWIEAEGPAGRIRTHALMTYDPASGVAVRHEIDAAGSVVTKRGKITGDLGGIYSFTWESDSFRRGGHELKMRGRTVAFSPQNFREFLQYSVDGGEFVAYGQPWYRKQVAGP